MEWQWIDRMKYVFGVLLTLGIWSERMGGQSLIDNKLPVKASAGNLLRDQDG